MKVDRVDSPKEVGEESESKEYPKELAQGISKNPSLVGQGNIQRLWLGEWLD